MAVKGINSAIIDKNTPLLQIIDLNVKKLLKIPKSCQKCKKVDINVK